MTVGVDLNGYGVLRRIRDDGSVTLVPADIHAEEWIRKLGKKEILIEGKRPRSILQHRWFFAMLQKVIDATGGWTKDSLLDAVKIATGHVQVIKAFDQETLTVPRSISFGSLDQLKFERFVRRAVWVIAEHLGVDAEKLMEETDAEFSEPGWFKKRHGHYMRKARG